MTEGPGSDAASASPEYSVQLTRFVEAPPRTVFDIVSTPEGFSAWMDGQADFEAKAGSPFTIHFPQFSTTVTGEVLEVDPDTTFAVSWGVSEGPQAEWFPPASSTVRIELVARDHGTEVTLTHASVPTAQEKQQHEAGWRFHLSRLQLTANRTHLEGCLGASWSQWCDAWSEADDDARAELLERCCAPDFEYQDDYATVVGRDVLSVHIANTLRYVAHTRLEGDGPPRICRGEVLIPWRGASDSGEVPFRGVLHARMGPDGRFRSMTSFWDNHDSPGS